MPKALSWLPQLSKDIRAMFDDADATEARAGAVMVVGFFARQSVSITAWATSEPAHFVAEVAERLYRYDIWQRDTGTLRCEWLETWLTPPTRKNKEAWRLAILSMQIDACVACGALTRTPQGESFAYGLPEWESRTAWTPERRRKHDEARRRKPTPRKEPAVIAPIVETVDPPSPPQAPPPISAAPAVMSPPPQKATSQSLSWWAQPKTREEFDAEIARRYGKIGRS